MADNVTLPYWVLVALAVGPPVTTGLVNVVLQHFQHRHDGDMEHVRDVSALRDARFARLREDMVVVAGFLSYLRELEQGLFTHNVMPIAAQETLDEAQQKFNDAVAGFVIDQDGSEIAREVGELLWKLRIINMDRGMLQNLREQKSPKAEHVAETLEEKRVDFAKSVEGIFVKMRALGESLTAPQ